MKEEIKMYLERAEKFKKNAQFNFENGDHDLAMFHIEQACQLMIKAKLLDQKGYFERTHSLRKLLGEVIDVEGVEEFFKEEVEEAFKALEELKKILWSRNIS